MINVSHNFEFKGALSCISINYYLSINRYKIFNICLLFYAELLFSLPIILFCIPVILMNFKQSMDELFIAIDLTPQFQD